METNDRELVERRVLGGRREPARLLQWLGFFLAPTAFFVHLQVAYVLVFWSCATKQSLWQHLVGLLAVVVALAGVAAAWVSRARTPEADDHPPGHPVEGPGPIFRTRFMADTGLGVSALLALILLMQFIGGFFITVCQ